MAKKSKREIEHEELVSEMPRFKVFLLKDAKSESYGLPIVYQNRGLFLRDVIQSELSAGRAPFAKHPQDFSVFEVGEFEPSNGQITMYETKNCLGLVQDFALQVQQ